MSKDEIPLHEITDNIISPLVRQVVLNAEKERNSYSFKIKSFLKKLLLIAACLSPFWLGGFLFFDYEGTTEVVHCQIHEICCDRGYYIAVLDLNGKAHRCYLNDDEALKYKKEDKVLLVQHHTRWTKSLYGERLLGKDKNGD